MLGMAQPISLCPFLPPVPMAWLLSIPCPAPTSPAVQPTPSPLQHNFCSCFLHILLIFPSTGSMGFLFSTVICLVTHHILSISVLVCPFLHQQVTLCLSSCAIPSHSAQAGVSCCLQTVSPAQTLSTLRCCASQ